MKKQYTEKEIEEIASQLSCPKGELGVDIGHKMNDTNIGMTLNALEALDISGNDTVLELGPGNCGHLKAILDRAENIRYYGLDISDLMKDEAEKINAEYVKNGSASFHLYAGEKIPFQADFFHRILTVNTIYFWKNPHETLTEIHRVLRDKGRLSIGFAQKKFMENLPISKFGFELYDTEKVKSLFSKASFKILDINHHSEKVESKWGEMVNKDYTIITAEK